MSLDSQEHALERWRRLRQRGPNDPDAEAELYGFFQSFRPDARGLDNVFAGVVGGPDLLQRLLEVYRATATGWDPADAYFLVRSPQPLGEAEAIMLAQRHRDSMVRIASHLGADEVGSVLEAAKEVSVVGSREGTAAAEGANLQIYEAVIDFMTSLTPRQSEALLLGEAYYAIACDYSLKYHLLWPLYRAASPLEEPFEAYFQLWKHGVQCDFGTHGIVALSTPTPSLQA